MKIYSEEIAEKIQKSLEEVELKSEGAEFEVIASNESIDRHGEIIKQNGWDLENYLKNPVILADHRYSIDSIVGKATNIRFEDTKMIIRGVFAKNSKGQEVQKLYEAGFLKTVSVGFIVKQRDESNRDVITKAELLELSFVPIPANPDAIDNLKELGLSESSIDFWMKSEKKEKSFEEKVDEKFEKILSEISEIKKHFPKNNSNENSLQDITDSLAEAVKKFS